MAQKECLLQQISPPLWKSLWQTFVCVSVCVYLCVQVWGRRRRRSCQSDLRETPCSQPSWPAGWLWLPWGGFTMGLVTPVFTRCRTASFTWTEGGLDMASTRIPACWGECFTARVQSAHRSDCVKHSTMGEDHSVYRLLQLWIQHQRLSSHTSDWWGWTNLLVCTFICNAHHTFLCMFIKLLYREADGYNINISFKKE